MGAKGSGSGCATVNGPTNYQIELNIPDSVLQCVDTKSIKNPGSKATKRQTAIYITKLHAGLRDCGANMTTVNRLYKGWKSKVKQVNG